MATYKVGDPGCPPHIVAGLKRVEEALGDYTSTPDQPCATAGAYYDEGAALPWRIAAPDRASESFATAEEAARGAEVWAEGLE